MDRSGLRSSKPIRAIFYPDVHVPAHDRIATKAANAWLATQHVDLFGLMGDVMDLELMGRFVDGKPGKLEDKRLARDFADCNAFLDEAVGSARTLNPACPVVYVKGNHESRLDAFLASDPRFEGLFDIKTKLRLEERGVHYVEADTDGDIFRIEWQPGGKVVFVERSMRDDLVHPGLTFTHGWYHGKHSAEKHAQCFGLGDVFFGHVHTVQVHTIERYGPRKPMGVTFGTLSRLDLDYVRKSPCTRWAHAFLDLTIYPRPYHYSMTIRRIIDGVVL